MVLLQGNNLAHHIINCPSPFLLLQGVKPSLHLYHKGCHPSHPSLQGNHFPNQILLGNHMEYPISSLLLHGLEGWVGWVAAFVVEVEGGLHALEEEEGTGAIDDV